MLVSQARFNQFIVVIRIIPLYLSNLGQMRNAVTPLVTDQERMGKMTGVHLGQFTITMTLMEWWRRSLGTITS